MLLNQLRYKGLSEVQHEAGGMMLIAAMGSVKDAPRGIDPRWIFLTGRRLRPILSVSPAKADSPCENSGR